LTPVAPLAEIKSTKTVTVKEVIRDSEGRIVRVEETTSPEKDE
jgi:hypothetical protein